MCEKTITSDASVATTAEAAAVDNKTVEAFQKSNKKSDLKRRQKNIDRFFSVTKSGPTWFSKKIEEWSSSKAKRFFFLTECQLENFVAAKDD